MASTVQHKKSCSKCTSREWVALCEGCHQLFCIQHAQIHRTELGTQLGEIEQQSHNLLNIFNQHEKFQEHPLTYAIDVWEHDSILKIQQIAQKARDDIKHIHDEVATNTKAVFQHFHEQIGNGREQADYSEIELDQWRKQLLEIKNQLETPCDIQLVKDDSLPAIDLIKITATRKSMIMPNISFPQQNHVNDDESKTIDSVDDSDVVKPSATMIQDDDNSVAKTLNSIETSTTPKEDEPQTTFTTSEEISIILPVLLDPTKRHHFCLLQSSSTTSNLAEILNNFLGDQLRVVNDNDSVLDRMKSEEQVTFFLDNYTINCDDNCSLLDNISELDNVYCVYIRGIPPSDDDELNIVFNRYAKLKAIFASEQRLATQWVLDTVNEYRKTGDMYCELGDKNNGRKCFEKGIELYKRLSIVLDKTRRPQL